ncbi:hypothetical protein PHMEG_00031155 [Phytophthora megakarya]|uniref:Uncharacterized protein n=1 Tax=Phytophthora megakarya TaxID=4795 RepID=A0A225V131_9STRA|nr:hypothetical protein PHMEG_00031155 [Phytophthora megakarya]
MVGDAKDGYVTYTLVITPQTASTPANTAKVKIKKYRGSGVREWLKWSYEFRQLAKKKNWDDEQKGANLDVLIEGDLAAEVAELREEASKKQETFETFFSNVGLLSVPSDFAEDLDNELWHMKKSQDETVHKFAARVKEIVRLFVELPVNAEVIPEVQQMRFLKRVEKEERRSDARNRQRNKATGNIGKGRFVKSNGNKPNLNKKEEEQNLKAKKGNGHGKWCTLHNTNSHDTTECFTLKKQRKEEQKQIKEKTTAKNKYPNIYQDSEDEKSSSDEEYKLVGLVTNQVRTSKPPLRIAVRLQDGILLDALLDSGASKSIINAKTLAKKQELWRQVCVELSNCFRNCEWRCD